LKLGSVIRKRSSFRREFSIRRPNIRRRIGMTVEIRAIRAECRVVNKPVYLLSVCPICRGQIVIFEVIEAKKSFLLQRALRPSTIKYVISKRPLALRAINQCPYRGAKAMEQNALSLSAAPAGCWLAKLARG
jgi:hypothetical protein